MKLLLIILALLLTGCASTNYQYTRPDYSPDKYKISQVVIMIEYLALKNHINSSWSFDENKHLLNQDRLYEFASEVLLEKGYAVSDSSLKTSGLVTDRNMQVKHYLNRKRLPHFISPPFIVRSVNITNSGIQALEELLAEIDSPVSPVLSDYKSYIRNNYRPQMSGVELTGDTAILLIQSYQQKSLLSDNWQIGFGVSTPTVGLGFETQMNQNASAYLIHTGSGDLLWSNTTHSIRQRNYQEFFSLLPENRN